jgi:ACS family tartrate transporter-like MFS transporter
MQHLFGLVAYYGILFWAPLLVKHIVHGHAPPSPPPAPGTRRTPDARVVSLAMLPYLFAALALVANAAHARRAREQRWHAVVPMALGALALALVGPLASAGHTGAALAALVLANVGAWAEHGPMATLWEGASAGDGEAAQAASFAIINSLGNVGGFVGSYLVGALQRDGDDSRATLLLGCVLAAAAVMVALYRLPPARGSDDAKPLLAADGGAEADGIASDGAAQAGVHTA